METEKLKLTDDPESLWSARLVKFDIEFAAAEWTLSKPGQNSVADLAVKIDWVKIFEKFNGVISNFPLLIKKIACCWLIGLGVSKLSPITVRTRLNFLTLFFFRLHENGYSCLSLVTDKEAQRIFLLTISEKYSERTTKSKILVVSRLRYLEPYIGDGFVNEPFTTKVRSRMLIGRRPLNGWEAPPEPVSLYLLREAISFLDIMSNELIRIRDKYYFAVEALKDSGFKTKKQLSKRANKAIADEVFDVNGEAGKYVKGFSASKQTDVAILIGHLQAACFIIITFTSGPRVSELRRATSDSVTTQKHHNGRLYSYYRAARSKRNFSNVGSLTVEELTAQEYPWVLSPAAVEAFEVLKKLSEPAREKSLKNNLWLKSCGNSLWPFNARKGFSVSTNGQINIKMNKFADYINLAELTGWEGRLHSHMGRKNFARFISKRDRSGLADLAVQYSHASAHSVDIHYARPDSEFRRLVREELESEMESIAVELAGLASQQIYTCPTSSTTADSIKRFVGSLKKSKDVRALLGRGVTLVPCQWGVCVYKQETSACLGTKDAPDPSNRTPKICSGCSNFLATPKHKLWWEQYRGDSMKLLAHSGLPKQTKAILEARLREATDVLRVIETGVSK